MGIRRALFKGHRLETWNRPLGRPEGFLSVTEADLQDFYDRYYVPANMSLVIIGGLSTKQMIAELEASPFGLKKDGVRNSIPHPVTQFPVPAERSKIVKLSSHVSFKTDQTEYKATWAFPVEFPHQARRVFDQVLGELLFDEIREKRGLAYSIRTDCTDFQDVCEYQIGMRISPEATPYIDELVRDCIEMLPSRRNLFDRKLQFLKQRCLMVDLAGQGLAANSADELASIHRIISMQDVWDGLSEVTFEHMAEAFLLLSFERYYTFITCP